MVKQFVRLSSLTSLNDQALRLLRELEIANLGDLLAFKPVRDAQAVVAAADGLIPIKEALVLLESDAQKLPLREVVTGSPDLLLSVGTREAAVLSRFQLSTIQELAVWQPFAEAEEALSGTEGDDDDKDPSAPDCVVPRCKKFTKNSKSYISFFKAEEISDLSLKTKTQITPIQRLFVFGADDCKTIYLGYACSYRQDWIHCGIHLGEPQGSVPLFMGQDTQISVLDWKRINRAIRAEDTRVSERLVNLLTHQRAVDEIARATAEEHQHGSTSSFGANAATAGSFVAAGAVVGGVGGGISGALAGLVIGNAANAAGAAPTLAGAAVGTAVGSVAGAAAGSLVFAGATTLGFVETDAAGERAVVGRSAQSIHQRSLQNASSLRSFWSNIVTQSIEEEQQRLRTDRVTNHNRIHALNAIYFEILNLYRVNIWLTDIDPLIFIPFKPLTFTTEILQRYWWIIRSYLSDPQLILALDDYFLTLKSEDSAADVLAALPEIGEVEADHISVSLDFDGSALEALIADGLLGMAAGSTLVAGALMTLAGGLGGPITLAAGAAGMAAIMIHAFYNAVKRENVDVTLETSGSDVALTRGSSANQNPEFVGTYTTGQNVAIETITGIKISNKNASLKLGIPDTPLFLDVSAVAFENVKASLVVRNRASIAQAVPSIGDLEDEATLSSGTLLVGGNADKSLAWPIAQQLGDHFSGVTLQQGVLEGEVATMETAEAKLSNLLGFLNANKYGFTRLILQEIEREQLICVLEQLTLGGVDLKTIAGTNPIGFCGAHIVLPLKRGPTLSVAPSPGIGVDAAKFKIFMVSLRAGVESDLVNSDSLSSVKAEIQAFLARLIANGNGSDAEKDLRQKLLALLALLTLVAQVTSSAAASRAAAANPAAASAVTTAGGGLLHSQHQDRVDDAIEIIDAIIAILSAPSTPGSTPVAGGSLDAIASFYERVMQETESFREQQLASDEVSLPSSAVFMEPVLSHAKGAERYDIGRNSHYDILPAPDILPADPNVSRRQDSTLTPTVPQAVLQQTAPPELPLPGSLTTALGEAGKLDLSTLLTTNAASLAATLSNLSQMATELAKASAQLTGDAQKEALGAAQALAEKIASVVESTLPDVTEMQATPETPTPTPSPAPPDTLEKKGHVIEAMKDIDKSDLPEETKKERKRTIGASIKDEEQLTYVFEVLFEDSLGNPYPSGTFRINGTIFETREFVKFNGGVALPIEDGQHLFEEALDLKPGGKLTLGVFATFDGLPEIGSNVGITLPSSPHVRLRFTMKVAEETVTETSVKSAVDKVVKKSGFLGRIEGALEQVATLGLELPFEIFEVGVTATGELGGTIGGNLAGEYSSSEETSDTDSDSQTESRTFNVRVPLFAWEVSVT